MTGLDRTDRISELPDALLLKILSSLPTKDVVATMVLSKQWQFLWMMVPRLEYNDDMYQDGEDWKFLRFVNSSLLLHEAPVLKSFYLKLGQNSRAVDVGVCVSPVVNRCVRELTIDNDISIVDTLIILPGSLYTGCKMLVTLTLYNAALVDATLPISFPSLKTLSLLSVQYPGDEFISKLFSSCPVLENLFVEQFPDDNVAILVVRVASLKFFTLYRTSEEEYRPLGLVMDTPSLEFLNIVDYTDGFNVVEISMPKVALACLDVTYSHTQQLLGSLTSVVQLELCLATSMDAYFEGTKFSQLEQLKLCTCEPEWLDLLMRLLKDSPKLKLLLLEQFQHHKIPTEVPRPSWNEPSHVPECLVSSLESFGWGQYEGKEEEKEVAKYILKNSRRLKKATIYPNSAGPVENLQMFMELSMSPRASSICQLDFHGNYCKCQFCQSVSEGKD